MKNFNIIKAGVVASLSLLLVSCADRASISGNVGVPGADVIVKKLNVNYYETLDTLVSGKDGGFRCKVDVKRGDPQFIYVFKDDTKLASLIVEAGDRVVIEADTLGNCSIEGSFESELLMEVESGYASFQSRMAGHASDLDNAVREQEKAAARKAMTEEYVKYYRDRLGYVMSHPYSLTVVPVMFQTVSEGFPLFSQDTDALHFRNACDSLELFYPNSRYVRSLRQEADRRMRLLDINVKLQNAEELGFPDIEMTDVNGAKIKLSEVSAKAVLLYFWAPSEDVQKMFNLDELVPLYKAYKSKGLEIYQVAVSADKASWARIVKDQALGWINVCDGLGTASPALMSYNVTQLPMMYLIVDGQIVDGAAAGKDLKKIIQQYLK